jgi:hypothetical protein
MEWLPGDSTSHNSLQWKPGSYVLVLPVQSLYTSGMAFCRSIRRAVCQCEKANQISCYWKLVYWFTEQTNQSILFKGKCYWYYFHDEIENRVILSITVSVPFRNLLISRILFKILQFLYMCVKLVRKFATNKQRTLRKSSSRDSSVGIAKG